MPCFWDNFVNAFDPDCLPGAVIYTHPVRARHTTDTDPAPPPFAVFADTLLTVGLSPTVAQITHIAGYDNSADPSGCTYDAWFLGGVPFVSPPAVGGALIGQHNAAINFDPNSDPIPYGSIPGLSDSGGTMLFDSNPNFVAVITIVTDVGVCYMVFAADYCY